MFAPHLPWQGEPLRDLLEERLGCPVGLDNDANCAARAEARYGAARGAASALMVTMGTGIGGAVLLDGRVVRGANGMAGEFGHMQVVPDGQPCECGRRGLLGAVLLGQRARPQRPRPDGRAAVGPRGHDATATRTGSPDRWSPARPSRATSSRAGPSRPSATGSGVGVANLVAALDPEVVVIGGGVSAAGDRLLDPARDALRRTLVGAAHRGSPTCSRPSSARRPG